MDKVKQEHDQLKRASQVSQHEYVTLKKNYESVQKYVSMLEAELNHMKQKIIRLNEIAEQFMQTPEVVESAFTAATTGAHRALNDLN